MSIAPWMSSEMSLLQLPRATQIAPLLTQITSDAIIFCSTQLYLVEHSGTA